MFELPWRIDRPLAIAGMLLPVAALSLYLRIVFDREDGRFRKLMNVLLTTWPVPATQEKKCSLFRGCLTAWALIFSLMTVFAFSVGVGIVRNKEVKPLSVEDLERIERMLREESLKPRPDPMLERIIEERGLKAGSEPPAGDRTEEETPEE